MNMMVTSTPLPDFSPADIARLLQLIAVLSSPDASKVLMEQFTNARDQAEIKIDEAVKRGARIETAEREHKEKLEREREEHANALATAQTSFDQACAAREKTLLFREAEAHDVKREAERLLKEAQAMKEDLDRRLETIRGAAL